jgi:L,D-peptidoglycan transpeptidase YkuD (ErfK/YbiS/YcfS/YnhG family)
VPGRGATTALLALLLAACTGADAVTRSATTTPGPVTALSQSAQLPPSPAVHASPSHVTPVRPAAARPVPRATAPRRATPKRTPRPYAAAHFPVPVVAGNAIQVVTVRAHGSYATVAAWTKTSSGWHLTAGPWSGRVGANGVVPGSQRKQGTDTTPAGTYTMTEAFGVASDPGTAMPYRHVGSDDWWVEDNRSSYYNQHRLGSQGGFDMSLPESDVNGSERLVNHPTQYRYVVVINFNRWPATPYRGAGIFLHVNGSGATAGCVSVPSSAMVTILRWLRPSAHPRIAIA